MPRNYIMNRKQSTDFNYSHPIKETHTIKQALTLFLAEKRLEGLRKRTLDSYESTFRYFQDYLNEYFPSVEDVQELQKIHFQEYIFKMQENMLSNYTINFRLRNFKTFFTYLQKVEIVKNSPVAKIKLLKTDKKTNDILSDEEAKQLLRSLDTDSYAQWRDRILILLLLDTGMRITECLSLRIQDIDFQNRVIALKGSDTKNRQTRYIPFSKPVGKELNNLITETKCYFGESIEHIFYNAYGDKFETDTFRKRLQRLEKKSGIHCTPHMLRKTFATNYINKGGNMFALQKILGHSDIKTTEIYVNQTDKHIRNEHDSISPTKAFFDE